MPNLKAKIAQISDLHMNSRVDRNITEMLKRILKAERPDILVVSGDLADQPLPWQMKKAARLVGEIQRECNLGPERVVVIPGNHDFKFWGNIGLRSLTRTPFQHYFGDRNRPVYRFQNLGVVIFAVNSNTLTEMMAAGKVESHDLQQLYGDDDQIQQDPELQYAHKIAVVHHHAAPIANVGSALADRVQESFMVFYNAGRFVEQLNRRGFSVILHGHKHVAGFVRVGCDFPEGRAVLSVVAAGSASHPDPDDARGHNVQIIDIFDDGSAKLEMRFFSADVERKPESCVYELESLSDVRRRRYSTFRRVRGYSSYEVNKVVKISEDGYTDVGISFCGARAWKAEGVKNIPLSLKVERPSYLRQVQVTPAGFARLERATKRIYALSGDIELADAQLPHTGLFQYGYKYRLINAHVISAKEFARHYTGTKIKSEYATVTCDEACDLMTLSVEFPPRANVGALHFQAVAEYVEAPLRGVTDERLDRGETVGAHEEETRRLRVREEGGARMLICPNPVPGMIYKLCWTFEPDEMAVPNLPFEAEVEAGREALLAMAAARSGAAQKDWEGARAVVDALAAEIAQRLGDENERLVVSFSLFDERSNRLKYVCANMEREALPSVEWFSGEGCAGFAFEKGREVFYHEKADEVGRFIHANEAPEFAGIPDPEALASFPWTYGSTPQRTGVVVGAVDIASRRKTSKLLDLINPASSVDKKKEVVRILQTLTDAAGETLFTMGLEEADGGAMGAGRIGF